jgi:hypothetical protein
MSKKFRLLMAVSMVMGLLMGLVTPVQAETLPATMNFSARDCVSGQLVPEFGVDFANFGTEIDVVDGFVGDPAYIYDDLLPLDVGRIQIFDPAFEEGYYTIRGGALGYEVTTIAGYAIFDGHENDDSNPDEDIKDGVFVDSINFVGDFCLQPTGAGPARGADKIEIPEIEVEPDFPGWDTRIQVQNLSGFNIWGIAFFWGPWSAQCASNSVGPIGHACMQIPQNGVWTLHHQIPDGARSAIIFSVFEGIGPEACADADCDGDEECYLDWEVEYGGSGFDIAATVDKQGPDPYGEFELSAVYEGIIDPQDTGMGPPYEYFAPYVMNGYNDLSTIISIQNSGRDCTSCWVYYKEQGNCEQQKAQHIELIAPGETVKIGPAVGDWTADLGYPLPELAKPWLGSAYVTCNEEMAIVIEQLSLPPDDNEATLIAVRAYPYKRTPEGDHWGTEWAADLLYREISGWQSSIQVQNLTQWSMPTFVTVEFFDQSGDSIFFLGDWICRNGTGTFYLPAIVDLGVNFPFGYVGAAEIESHQQVDYPGEIHEGEPIAVLVDIKKVKLWDGDEWRHTDPGETQAGGYNAHDLVYQKYNRGTWCMPEIAKEQFPGGKISRIAIRNNSNCNKIRGNIYIKDETGTAVAIIPVGWLHPKHIKIVDLAYQGAVFPGFLGAGVFVVEGDKDSPGEFEVPDRWGVEQLCDVDHDGHVDPEPIAPSVVVLNYKHMPDLSGPPPLTTEGDLTEVYTARPAATEFGPFCEADILGKAHVRDPGDDGSMQDDTVPLPGVLVEADAQSDTTDSTGDYEVTEVEYGEDVMVSFSKDGYLPGEATVDLDCGEDKVVDCELPCLVTFNGSVMVSDVDNGALVALAGATLDCTVDADAYTGGDCAFEPYEFSATTDANGVIIGGLVAPLFDDTMTCLVRAGTPMVAQPRTFEKAIMDDAVDRGTYGVTPQWVVNDAWELPEFFQIDPFEDHDCPWNPAADNAKPLTPFILCALGNVFGNVQVNGQNAVGWLVTATRVFDNFQLTFLTDANGNYQFTLPTGVAATEVRPTTVMEGNVWNIQVGATIQTVTFEHCGQDFTANFNL